MRPILPLIALASLVLAACPTRKGPAEPVVPEELDNPGDAIPSDEPDDEPPEDEPDDEPPSEVVPR